MNGNQIATYVIITVIAVVVVLIVNAVFSIFSDAKDKKTRAIKIVEGTSDLERGLELKKSRRKDNELDKKKVKKKKKIPFIDLYQQYLFFGGTKKKFWLTIIIGYIAFVGVYFIFSKNIIISLILSLLYLVLWYVFTESSIKKKRINYLKSFVSCLDIISSSIQAGNSLEESFYSIIKRDKINPRMKTEFTILSNNLKSNIPMEEALERFLQRNNLFSEFSMFVIVIQFFVKSGGRNMKKIFSSLQTSLNQKVENYATIEGNLTQYVMAFNLFLVLEVAATFIAPIFLKDFYTNVAADFLGYLKLAGSVLLAVFCTYMFKSSIKTAAEA